MAPHYIISNSMKPDTNFRGNPPINMASSKMCINLDNVNDMQI